MSKVTTDDLAALMQIFDASDWTELHLTVGGTDLFLSKDPNAQPPGRAAPASLPPTAATPVPPAASVAGSPQKAGDAIPPGWTAIRAPNLGTFYRAPKPGAPPYVSIGQEVTADTEICLIEVMKLFTAVRAGVAGTIREVCVSDGELVEFDQTLFLIEPHG